MHPYISIKRVNVSNNKPPFSSPEQDDRRFLYGLYQMSEYIIMKKINPGLCGSLRCRAIGYVSREWVGLPPDFHWAKNFEKPQDSEFSQQRLRELLESSLRSPEDNLPEALPIPGIRHVLFGSLIVLSALHINLNSSLKVNDMNILTILIQNLHSTKYRVFCTGRLKLVPPERCTLKVHFTER